MLRLVEEPSGMVGDELKELLQDFVVECDERLAKVEYSLLALETATTDQRPSLLESIRRDLHTLKGNSGMMGLGDLQGLAHRMEDAVSTVDLDSPGLDALFADLDVFKAAVDRVRPEQRRTLPQQRDHPRETSIRVATAALDRLLELATELMSIRHRLAESVTAGLSIASDEAESNVHTSRDAWHRLEETRLALERLLTPLDDGLRRLRMVPLRGIFNQLQRLARDESHRAGKKMELVTRGEETPLDAALVEVAGEALGHLVRNAIIHGIQTPELRRAAGKGERGTILVEAAVRSQRVEVEVLDDGTGIDRRALCRAALANGVEIDPAADLHTLVFHPGLSSRQRVDHSSGRGIGTVAVLDAVHRYGGTIEVDSRPGIGTRFTLQLPLTVAVADALLLRANGQRYALPIAAIIDTMAAAGSLITADDQLFIRRKGLTIPTIGLSDFLTRSGGPSHGDHAVILNSEGRLFGLVVDDLHGLAKVVVTPLDPALGRPPGIGGSTVLGDGEVVLLLDPPALARAAVEVPA